MAADVSSTFSSISSTESNNQPQGTTAVGTNLDDNIRMCQALMAAWRDQSGWAGLALTSVSGTNTITATLATAGSVTFGPTALSTGMRFFMMPANSNTGAATLNITSPAGGSALGAKSIFLNGLALVGYEIRKNCPVELYYDGTQFHIVGGAHGGDGIPIATESTRYFSTAPNSHLLMDGSAVSRTTYADLFAVLGTTHGAGDGSTTFNLPNRARRVTVGSGGSGTSTLGSTVGSTGGEENHTLTTNEIPAHSHGGVLRNGGILLNGGGGGINPTDGSTDNAGGGAAHNNMQPSIVVYACIKY